MRSNVLSAGVLCELNDTVNNARDKFHKWMKFNDTIPSDLKETVYSAGIKYGGVNEWEYCWNIYNSTVVPSEKKMLLKSLGVSSDPWVLQR